MMRTKSNLTWISSEGPIQEIIPLRGPCLLSSSKAVIPTFVKSRKHLALALVLAMRSRCRETLEFQLVGSASPTSLKLSPSFDSA